MLKKTDLIIFRRKHARIDDQRYTIALDKNIIEEKVKYLGVLDQLLTFQDEVKMILGKMACGIEALQSIKKPLPIKTRLLLINALLISHLHYPTILLNGTSANLTISLEKQLSWAIKTCCDRAKIDSSSNLKLKHNVFPVTMFLERKVICHFWRKKTSLITSL